MKDAQTRLDKGASTLMRLIRQAETGAAEACEAGQPDAAKSLHRAAAYMRLAYAEGRGLAIETPDGVVRPAFGGDK